MISEVTHLANDVDALRWSFGCLLASYYERMSTMGRSKLDVSTWLLGLEVLVCLGPITLMWVGALYVLLSTSTSATSVLVPTLLGTMAPIGLALAMRAVFRRRIVSAASFTALALGFATLAALQLIKGDAAWFAFDWRVLVLNSILPCLACAHLALIGLGNGVDLKQQLAS